MSWTFKTLEISQEVSSGNTVSTYEVIPSGKRIHCIKFEGHGVYSVNSVVKSVWDPDGTPEIIWSTKGDTESFVSKEYTGNGTKKLSLALENGEDGALVMSGRLIYYEED
jgi:hypothetical protein